MILAYETSTNICSVAFQNISGEVMEKKIQGRSVHSDNLFLFTKELMDEQDFKIAELNAVLVSNGPGSYTGLRIAASALKGILFGTDVKLYAVNTLASFAMNTEAEKGDIVHSIIDARRTHLYMQSFEFGDPMNSISETRLAEISDFEEQVNAGDHIIGTGINRLEQSVVEKVNTYNEESITARSLLKLFELQNFEEYCIKTSLEALNPNYISSSQVNNSNA